nr:hypothetical protein [Tanacetum cinerariifolium]
MDIENVRLVGLGTLNHKLKEVWFKICDEQIFFQDFLNTSESSNDDSNVIKAPQEPIVFNQEPCEDYSQSPLQIDLQCCYECGDPLDGVFCRRCTCESCGNGAHIGYNCPPKVSVVSNPEPCHNQNVDKLPQTLTNFHPTCYYGDEDSFAHNSTPKFDNDSPDVFHPPPQTPMNSYEFCGNDAHFSHDCPHETFQCQPMNYYEPNICYESNYFGFDQFQPPQPPVIHQPPQETSVEISHDHENELAEYINIPSWNCPEFSSHDDDDDDENYTIVITPEEPDNSLSMGDEHLDTIPATKSNEVIKSSVEDLVPIPNQFEEFSDSNDDSTSIDDDYFFIDNIDYIELSPHDSELVSLEEVKDDNLHEKLMNINLLIAKIKSLNDNPTPDHVLKSLSSFLIPVEDSDSFLEKSDTSLSYSDNSLPEFETFSNHTKETNSGSTTTHADYSLSKYDAFLYKIEPDQGELTSVVILAKPRVHVPNVLTTHPTFMLDSDFIPSDNSLPEFEIFCFDIEEKNSGSTTIHIRENVLSATNVNLPPKDDHSPLFAYVVWIFLSFSRVSHWSGTFMKLNVYPNHLNESPMEILSSITFPRTNAATPQVLAIQGGRIHKSQNAKRKGKGKGKGKDKLAYAPTPKNPKPSDKGRCLLSLERGRELEEELSCVSCCVDEEKEAYWFCQYFR